MDTNTDTRQHANGTSITQRFPWGIFVKARALCSDGKVRSTARISIAADTFFSVPAAVRVKGKTVSGFIMFEDDTVRFIAYSYGKNASLLPEVRS